MNNKEMYELLLEWYKEKFPDHDIERYVPKFKDDSVYSSIHNKVDGKYETGCIDDELREAV